jgi:hypothetical protein
MKASTAFLVAFLLAAAVITPLARAEHQWAAVLAGVVVLLAHWASSRGDPRDAELADSSYFLGFLLTLVLLAAGLWSLGTQKSQPLDVPLYGFLSDLAAGLVLTIAGLAIRQIRTLSRPYEHAESGAGVPAQPPPVIEPARELSPDAAIVEAAPRIAASLRLLEEHIATASATLTRTSNALSEAVLDNADRIASSITAIVTLLDAERLKIGESLVASQRAAEATQAEVAARTQAQIEDGRATLESARAAARSFDELTKLVTSHIENLPNPAERLQNLWAGVETLDGRLRASLGEAIRLVAAMGTQAQIAADSVEKLTRSSDAAAAVVARSGSEMAYALDRELRHLDGILEEFHALLNAQIRRVAVR